MFIGHFAVAFAAKKVAPRTSLGTLVLAATLADVVWPVLVLLGVERFRIVTGYTPVNPFEFLHYPWSHSLLMAIGWGIAFALITLRALGPWREFMWLAALVVSHWLLDMLTHRPDLPLTPGVTVKLGLGVWNSIPLTFVVEGAFFAAGILIYARRKIGRAHV